MKEKSLRLKAYSILKDRIINCEYSPGMLLSENILKDEFDFSRTPVREAFRLIEQEGYVKFLPKKGIIVNEISLNDVKQIFEVRKEIEPITLKLALPYLDHQVLKDYREKFLRDGETIKNSFELDTEMHLYIIKQCKNDFLIDMLKKVFEQNKRIVISSKQNELKIHDAKLEHLQLLDLILDNKNGEAVESLKEHIIACEKAALDFFYNYY